MGTITIKLGYDGNIIFMQFADHAILSEKGYT